MAVRTIVKMGAESLYEIAKPVRDFGSEELSETINDMIDTMRHYHGVGLAAPQIGVNKRIIILEVANNSRYPDAEAIPLDILINPEITSFSKQTVSGWEGCLSLPGLRGRVTRAQQINYQASDEHGYIEHKIAYGFHARIIQHEIDHLNGILYPKRLDDWHEFGFEDSLADFQQLNES